MGTIESLSFQRYQDTDRRVWASFVDRCDEAWVYHTPEFIEAAAYDCSFSVLVDGDLQGVCVLGRERRRLGAYLSGPGLALLPGAHQAWIYQGLLTKLHHLAVTARCECVEFVLPPLAPANYRRSFPDCVLGQCGFGDGIRWRRASEPLPGYFSVIDLTQDAGKILSAFSKGQKSNVKRCEKLNLRLNAFTAYDVTADVWADFVNIHKITYARTGGRSFSAEKLGGLYLLARTGRILLVNGYEGAQCVTSLLLAIGKGGAFYYAGGALDVSRQHGVMAWAHYQVICWLKEHGFEHYCMGFTVPALSGTEAGGIGDFKKRFGGEQWPMLCGDLILRPKAFLARHQAYDLFAGPARVLRTLRSRRHVR